MPASAQDLKTRIREAINGYGQVIGLESDGRGSVMGSLHRVRDLLDVVANTNPDQELRSKAQAALDAVNARERVNGTIDETSDPEGFKRLTDLARTQLRALRSELK